MRPPASQEALAEPIYEAFFGLKNQPFQISTDPKFFFPGGSHQYAHDELLLGLQRRESLMVVTGETGTGKTTLCRAVVNSLGTSTYLSVLHNPNMLGVEMLRVIVRDFGLATREELRHGSFANADAARLSELLESFVQAMVPHGAHAIVVMDEAQNLTPALLEEMRMLTAFEHEGQQLLQIILCGRPQLLDTLKPEAMSALNDRITRRVSLTPLQPADVDSYIRHRLDVAGAGETVVFDAAATEAVFRLSRGLPRRVNVLCDRALQEGRIAGRGNITRELVNRAARALAGAPRDSSTDEDGTATDDPSIDLPVGVSKSGVWLRQHAWRMVGVFFSLLVLGSAAGAGLYARSIVVADPRVPLAPAAPVLNHEPALPRPAPTDADIAAIQPNKRPQFDDGGV